MPIGSYIYFPSTPNAMFIVSRTAAVNISNCALPSSEINEILALSVTLGPSSAGNYCFTLQGQTPPAPPTGQGITDNNTLLGWGVLCVTTD